MSEQLQVTTVETPDKKIIFVTCPGLSKEDITVSFDSKDGILEILGNPKEDKEFGAFDLSLKGSITISKKYRSKTIEAKVENGILSIIFGLADDVNLVSVK